MWREIDFLHLIRPVQLATKTRGLEKPSFCWFGGDGRESEPEPELILLVEEDLDSGPRIESLSWFALKPPSPPIPPPSQSS